MDLHQLRCFVTAAEELHFGRAAQRLEMLPSALGRHMRLLEEDLGTRLMTRTTRSVTLTDDGAILVKEGRALLEQADALAAKFRTRGRKQAATVRVGAIDSAAAGLLPMLLRDFRERRPDVTVQLVEDKTIRLLPRLLSGRLDLAFVRPPESPDKRLEFMFLFHETAVVAVSDHHPLASRKSLTVADLALGGLNRSTQPRPFAGSVARIFIVNAPKSQHAVSLTPTACLRSALAVYGVKGPEFRRGLFEHSCPITTRIVRLCAF